MNVATTTPRCPFCGRGADTLRLTHRPQVGAVGFHLAVECTGCQETFRIAWRGRHADEPLLAFAYRAGMPVAAIRKMLRWRDLALAAYFDPDLDGGAGRR
ncbi:hypothetical protein [Thermaerobacter composti]|uniref:Lar family restriction alleviation protein n=1 Tax=Thermaerobacter composti TaxID=554949 RepID=A0ABZ0QLQ4_9FIRM|nr:hypothetical protein [Thermaerobacter composti]PZN04867.1 MAG: hypothetical protein DIU76_08440 [Bacillota bacterium]WPD17978.1 hypothetical protein Q5761_06145 [Thermaerobacter composti]